MHGALGPFLVGLLAVIRLTTGEDRVCEDHCSHLLSSIELKENLWKPSEACKLGCRWKKLDSLLLSEANSTCTSSCLEAFSSGPNQGTCLLGCSLAYNHTSFSTEEVTQSSSNIVPASVSAGSLVQLLLTSLLTTSGQASSSRDPNSLQIHVVDVTLVTVDDPNNPNGTVRKITVMEGSVPLAQEDSASEEAVMSATVSSASDSSSGGDGPSDARLIELLMLMQLLFIAALGILTVFLCCYFFRPKPKNDKDATEVLMTEAEGTRLCRLADVMGDEVAPGQLYKPPLLPTYKQALEQNQVVLRLAITKEPKVVEGILTVVPNKQPLPLPQAPQQCSDA